MARLKPCPDEHPRNPTIAWREYPAGRTLLPEHRAEMGRSNAAPLRGIQFGAGEEVEHFGFGGRVQDVVLGEILRLGIRGFANALGGLLEIVAGAAEMDVVIEEEPVGAGFAEGHADAAGVDDADFSDVAIKLHVRVAANDDGVVDSGEDGEELCFRCEFREDFVFIARRGVAEEDSTQIWNLQAESFGPGGDEAALLVVELLAGPADAVSELFGHAGTAACQLGQGSDFAVT